MSALSFQDFVEQSASIENLHRDFQSGQFVHAYLFVGARGVGKRSLAMLCAQSLYCAAQAALRPCGICDGCLRVAHRNHPDVFTLQPEKSIGVDAVRDLIASIQMRAFEAGHKCVVIEQAEKMTVQAQNCLLKTLEEPPRDTVFFLLAESLGAMLPTIRSRCRMIALPPLSPEALEKRLLAHHLAPDRAALLSRLAAGSVGQALDMDQDASYWQLRERVLHLLFGGMSKSAQLSEAASFKDDRARANDILGIVETSLSDAIQAKTSGLPCEIEGYPDGWQRFVRGAPIEAMLDISAATTQAKKWIASNVSFQAALEMLVLKISEESTVWQW